MKRTLLFAFLLLQSFYAAHAGNSLLINNPLQGSWILNPGKITDVSLNVYPEGLFVRHELTFTLNTHTNYSSLDTLEAVLKFDLPENSFIHQSWLWLNNTVIIEADLIEKNRAISIYEGIVRRRRDPSLLTKTGPSSYQLNVYPMTKNFPRKVKITYSTPLSWNNGRAYFPLPVQLLKTSAVQPAITLKLYTGKGFQGPACAGCDLASMQTGGGAAFTTYNIPASQYSSSDVLYLSYASPATNGMWIGAHPTGASEGVYQLAIDPAQVSGNVPSRNIVFVLDHPMTYINNGAVFAFPQIRNYLRAALQTQLRATDSFNVFYVDNNAVLRTFSNWQLADSAGIAAALGSIPASISSDLSKFEQLMKDALSFSHTRVSPNTQTVFISSNNSVISQSSCDTLFNRVKNHLGSFKNKINVFNYSGMQQWISGMTLTGSELLFNKLCLASGGNYAEFEKKETTYTQGGYMEVFTFDAMSALGRMLWQVGYNTPAYNIGLPLSGGYTHSEFPLNNISRLCFGSMYTETGRYTGSLNPAGNVTLQAAGPGGILNQQIPVQTLFGLDSNARQTWTSYYLTDLIATGSSFNNEAIDSSIRNQVLCDLTAFLAVETGDTVKGSINKEGGTPISAGQQAPADHWVKAAPNPFSDALMLSFSRQVDYIEIYDVQGRLLLRVLPGKDTRSFSWDGRNGAGADVPAGVYIVRVGAMGQTKSLKVQKL